MPNSSEPCLRIPLNHAEDVVRQLRSAAKETGRTSFLQEAERLQKEIDAQFSQTPPRH